MAGLILSGILNFGGTLKLNGADGGKVCVQSEKTEVLVENSSVNHSTAAVPVLLPPQAPVDPGKSASIFKSFNSTITANGKNIVTMGMFKQGNQQTWPGIVNRSIINPTVTINTIPINVKGDMGTTLPNGAPATFTESGQS